MDFHWSPSEILVWMLRTASQLICLAESLHTARQTPVPHEHRHTHTITTSVLHVISSSYPSQSASFTDDVPLPYIIQLCMLSQLHGTVLSTSLPRELPIQLTRILLTSSHTHCSILHTHCRQSLLTQLTVPRFWLTAVNNKYEYMNIAPVSCHWWQ